MKEVISAAKKKVWKGEGDYDDDDDYV